MLNLATRWNQVTYEFPMILSTIQWPNAVLLQTFIEYRTSQCHLYFHYSQAKNTHVPSLSNVQCKYFIQTLLRHGLTICSIVSLPYALCHLPLMLPTDLHFSPISNTPDIIGFKKCYCIIHKKQSTKNSSTEKTLSPQSIPSDEFPLIGLGILWQSAGRWLVLLNFVYLVSTLCLQT